jgi:hypothetical protein
MFLIVDCYLIQILSCVYAKKSKYYIYEKKNEHIWKVDATLEKVKLKPIEILYTLETLCTLEWHWKAKKGKKGVLQQTKEITHFKI